ncbi:MAG: NUDIX domain-containing protein [Saprospiraceae bacterium]
MAKFKVSLKARLILFDRGRVLLLHQTKPNGGNFSLVGGTIERQEFAKQSLVRESREEAGIILQENDLSLVHVLHKRRKKEHRIVLYFKAYRYSGEVRNREPHKFSDVNWHDLNDLPENLTDTVRRVLRAYRRGQLYSQQQK